MKSIYFENDDILQIRVSDKPITREVSQDWHTNIILAALGLETFVNADYIARGLSGRNTDAVNFEAGRIMFKRLRQLGDAIHFANQLTVTEANTWQKLQKQIA